METQETPEKQEIQPPKAAEDIGPVGKQAMQGPQDAPQAQSAGLSEVEPKTETLPDGRESHISGDPEGMKKHNHLQGQNDLGYQGTCGLVSCEDVLNQHGKNVSENDIVSYADQNNLCENEGSDVAKLGGTSPGDQAKILSDHGVPAHVETGKTLDDLAANIEQGKSVIPEVNAGELWQDANYLGDGSYNHAVVATGVARDPASNEIQGFFINDSGPNQSGRFVDSKLMKAAWEDKGGIMVVTDKPRPA